MHTEVAVGIVDSVAIQTSHGTTHQLAAGTGDRVGRWVWSSRLVGETRWRRINDYSTLASAIDAVSRHLKIR
jgi:hypothetical protein